MPAATNREPGEVRKRGALSQEVASYFGEMATT